MNNLDKKKTEKIGYLFVLADMLTYGLLPVGSHYFVRKFDPLMFAAVITLLGSLPLLAYLAKKGCLRELFQKRFLKSLLVLSLLAAAGSIFFFVGAQLTSGINTGLLIQLEPFYSLVIAAVLLGEALVFRQILATSLMVLGAIVIVFKGSLGFNLGDVLILLTPFFFQFSHVVAKRVLPLVSNASVVPAARMFYSGLILFLIAFLLNPQSFGQVVSPVSLAGIVAFAFIFRTLDMSLWYEGIKRLPLAKASALLPLAALVSFLGSIVLLKEMATPQQFFGLILIVGGLIWLSLQQLKSVQPS